MMLPHNIQNIKMFLRIPPHTSCRGTLKINSTIPKIVPVRSIHLACKVRNTFSRNNSVLNIHRRPTAFTSTFLRFASTNNQKIPDDILNHIPDPPPLPSVSENEIADVILQYHANGEPTFSSLGLGGYTPSGLLQTCFEFLHINAGVPWWGSILLGTLCIRLIMFPLVIKQQRVLAEQNKLLPEFQKLQLEMNEANMSNDIYEKARARQKFMQFVYNKGFSPFKNLPLNIVQVVTLTSNFFALRGMANLPVESFKEGGLGWFTDLTVCDPYYILPTITSLTLFVTLEIGAEFANPNTLGKMKYVLRVIPAGVFLFTLHFPAALLWYWSVSNCFTLLQVGFLRIPSIRKALKLPKIEKHDPSKLPASNKSFREEYRTTLDNYKVSRRMADVERLDSMQFKKAGRGPPPITYKYDPTKLIKTSKASARER